MQLPVALNQLTNCCGFETMRKKIILMNIVFENYGGTIGRKQNIFLELKIYSHSYASPFIVSIRIIIEINSYSII